MSVNIALIMGVVDRVEINATKSGGKVANMRVRTVDQWVDKDGNPKLGEQWHSVCAFGQPADFIEKSVKQGDTVWVEGSIRTRSYEHDGSKRYSTEINARVFKKLYDQEKK